MKDAAEPIPTHRFNTAVMPEEQQFPAWAAFTAHSRVTRPGEGPFHVDARFWQLEEMIVSAQTVDRFAMERDESYLNATDASHFLVVVPLDGESQFTAPGIDQTCRSGDVILANLRYVARCDNLQRQRTCAVSIASGFLEAAAGRVDAHGRLRRSAETRLFAAFLSSLVLQLPYTPPAGVASLSRILRDLLANAVLSAGPAEPAAGGLTPGLMSRARTYIDSQPPGSLDLTRMLDALGATRSTVYRLFRDEGGVAAYDRRRRLRLVHRAVADPLDQRSLAAIGFDHGFEDAPHLARQFRQAFGYSMSALRSQVAHKAPALAAQGQSTADHYRELVKALG